MVAGCMAFGTVDRHCAIKAPLAALRPINHSDKAGSLLCPGHPRVPMRAHIYKTEVRRGLFLRSCGFHPITLSFLLRSLSLSRLFVMRSTAALFTLSALVSSALGATYPLKDKFVGQDFLTGFSHEAIADPTHGRV